VASHQSPRLRYPGSTRPAPTAGRLTSTPRPGYRSFERTNALGVTPCNRSWPNGETYGSAAPTLVELVDQLAAGRTTSKALVSEALRGIDATQPTLNAFRVIRHRAALAEAVEADRRLAAGERLPLLGVPIAIKDDIDMAGEPTAFGCAGDFPPAERDCEAVRRLRAAGAVIVGKTNSPEIGQWPFTEGTAFGATRNPWNLDHSAGGRPAARPPAVAAGLVPAAVGSDGAGSVRIPAAWNHLVGVKPQTDRVPTWPEPELFHGLTVIGPIARTVEDAALLLDILADSGGTYAKAAAATPAGCVSAVFRIPLQHRAGPAAPADPGRGRRPRRRADRVGPPGGDRGAALRSDGAGLPARSLTGFTSGSQRVPEKELLDPRTRENGRTGWLLSGPALKLSRAADVPLRKQVGSVFKDVDVVLDRRRRRCRPPKVGTFDGLSTGRLTGS